MRSISSVVVSIVVLCALVWTPGCEDLVGEVRDTYAQYMKAKDDKDAATVLALTDPQYIEHLDFVVKMAKSAERDRVKRLSGAERLQVVRMRNRLTKAELAQLDGKGWLTRTVNEGWSIDDILGAFDLGAITIKRPRAQGTMEIDGLATTIKVEFVKTGDKWVLDPIAIEELINNFLKKVAPSEEAEDYFIMERESYRSGKKVGTSIWEVPK
jgi:hypothetical protein